MNTVRLAIAFLVIIVYLANALHFSDDGTFKLMQFTGSLVVFLKVNFFKLLRSSF